MSVPRLNFEKKPANVAMKMIRRSIALFLVFALGSGGTFGQCDLTNIFDDPFDIPDNGDTCLTFTISGVLFDDLSVNNLVEAISLEFQHDAVSDLVIDLTSPSGQVVTLVGDFDMFGGFTTGSSWQVLFSQCAVGVNPDSGISDTWDNTAPWVIGGSYDGTYYPSGGCLEDFNMGSVNGTWTICIRDGFQFNTGSIDRIGSVIDGVDSDNCNQCNPEAGTQSDDVLTVCTKDDLNLDLGLTGNTGDPDYSLVYMISQNNVVTAFNTDNNFSNLIPGTYDICAISVKTEDLISLVNTTLSYQELIDAFADGSIPFCADLSDACTTLELSLAPATVRLNEVICAGGNFSIGGEVFNSSGSFAALLLRSGTDLCDTTVVLNLEVVDIDPIIQVSAPQLSCSSPEIVLDAGFSEGAALSMFAWFTPDGQIDVDTTQSSITISQVGTYFLDQSLDGCTLRTSVEITAASDIPQASIFSPVLTCEEDAVTLTVASTAPIALARWTGPAGYTSSIIEPTVTQAGRYQVALTATNGCQFVLQHTVEQGPDLPIITASAPNISCNSSAVQISVSNLGFDTYRWRGPLGFVSNVAEPTVTAAGTYFLEVQDTSGCKGFTSVDIFGDLSALEYEVSGRDFRCIGGRTTISANTDAINAVYNWTGPNNFISSTASNSVTSVGTYYVEIIANGCVARDSVVLERDFSDLPEYDVNVDNIGDCQNPLWRLTAIPLANEFQASRVRWTISGLGVIGEGTTVDVDQPGRYRLLVNTFNGCTVSVFRTVAPPAGSPVVTVDERIVPNCLDSSAKGIIAVSEGTNYTYQWSAGVPQTFSSDLARITGLDPDTYNLLVTDTINRCVTSLTVIMPNPDTIPRVTSTRNTNIDCNNPNATINLSVNGGGNSYDWSGPEGAFTTRDISVTTAGLYRVTVTGGNGCITLDSVDIIEDISPPNYLANDLVLECETQSANLDLSANEAGVLFDWTGPNNFSYSASVPVVFATGEYFVTLTGLNGCIANDSLVVSTNPDTPIPVASVLDTLTCIDTLVSIFSEATVPVVAYSWDGPGTFTSTEQNPMVSESGEYVVTIESTEGCIGFDTVEVAERIILPEINYTFDPTVDCQQTTVQFQGISSDPGATFAWTGPNDFAESGQIVSAMDTGTYFYNVRGSNSCVASDSFRIVPATTSFTLSYTSNCTDPGITIAELSDQLSYNMIWNGPNGFSSTANDPTPENNGIYSAVVTGSNGCIANITTTVSLDTVSPMIGISQIGEVRCEEDLISLDASGSSTGMDIEYLWTSSDGQVLMGQDSFITQIQGIGTYFLTVLDNTNGCTSLLSTEVTEADVEFMGISFGTTNPRCFGEDNGTVFFNEGAGGTLPYSFSLDGIVFGEEPSIGNLAPGEYNLTVKDSFGCTIEEPFTIVETEELQLDLGDNINVLLGDQAQVSATTNIDMDQIESIKWQIENTLGCTDCLSFAITPAENVQIELTLMNDRGCIISDKISVIVDQDPVLFKPNIFSPNGDGANDIFFVHSNLGVAQITSMSIFDRWGSRVFTKQNFLPGDPTAGWDGKLQGQVMQSGVYPYTIQVEMRNGVKRLIRGSVTLLR